MVYGARLSLYGGDGLRKYVNFAERERLLDVVSCADPLQRTLCLTLLYTGCRLSEALELRPQSIQLSEDVVAFRCLKKRNQFIVREVPVPTDFMAQLDEVHQIGRTQLQGAETKIAPLWNWGRTQAWRIVKSTMIKADISGLQACPKGLRHGFGVHAVRVGVPLNLLQKWLGHENMETTAIYANATGPEERAIAERMWA